MRIRPLGETQRKRRPWALILKDTRGIRVLTEAGDLTDHPRGTEATDAVRQLDGHALFTDDPRALCQLTEPTGWLIRSRRARATEMRLDGGPRVSVLPAGLLRDDRDQAVYQWATYLLWLDTLGVFTTARTSWRSLGRHLYAGTIRRGILWKGPDRPGRAPLYGGRRQVPLPGCYANATAHDLAGAYPHELARPMPRRLRYAGSNAAARRQIIRDPDVDGIAYATVIVPDQLWVPLPTRVDARTSGFLRWESGELKAWWPVNELRMALDYGCRVTPWELYAGSNVCDDFAIWYGQVKRGRELGDGADQLAKHHANLLWSTFSMSGAATVWRRYIDASCRKTHVVKVIAPPRDDFSQQSVYVSAIVAARVRERVYREALMPDGEANRLAVQVDTDGIIAGARGPQPNTGAPGCWRRKTIMREVELRSPAAYRYLCPRCGDDHAQWHYVCSGVRNRDVAARRFAESTFTREQIDLGTVEPDDLGELVAQWEAARLPRSRGKRRWTAQRSQPSRSKRKRGRSR